MPESQGGYDPGVQACYNTWKAHNAPPKLPKSPFIEEQGPIAGWCQVITLFADAAKKAGPDLTRRSFVEAMATIKNFNGTWSPTLSFGPDKFAGPHGVPGRPDLQQQPDPQRVRAHLQRDSAGDLLAGCEQLAAARPGSSGRLKDRFRRRYSLTSSSPRCPGS